MEAKATPKNMQNCKGRRSLRKYIVSPGKPNCSFVELQDGDATLRVLSEIEFS